MKVKSDSMSNKICHQCIGDDFLADEVKKLGQVERCTYCEENRETICLEDLALRVHEVIQKVFWPVPAKYARYAYGLTKEGRTFGKYGSSPTADVIADLVGVSREYAKDLVMVLAHTYESKVGDTNGQTQLYGPDSLLSRLQGIREFRGEWVEFTTELRSKARFFGPHAENILQELFGDLTIYQTSSGRSVIRTIGPGDEDGFIWRGRVAHSRRELREFLGLGTVQLGPPPSQSDATGRISPSAGRMNAPGVPVFYGASDLETCVAEVRPPVGSFVVAAKFELLKSVHLLDFDALDNVEEGSYFDPDFVAQSYRAAFLRFVARKIAQPVMPQDEASEYVTTQVLADFLANKAKPRLHGVIFGSSQTRVRGSIAKGKNYNVVLFNHAREVETYIPSFGSGAYVNVAGAGIIELRNKANEETPYNTPGSLKHWRNESTPKDAFLALVPQSIVVRTIKRVQYEYTDTPFNASIQPGES